MLLVEMIEQFEQGRATTVSIISITTGSMYVLGPITGTLADFYGSRIIVILGAVVSTFGFILSVFATNVYHLWITYGLIGGIGFGMMFVPTNTCVLHNFKSRRTLANGITVCGSGVGVFAVNHLVRFLIDHYGWRGAVLLEAGLVLQSAVVGLFLVRTVPDIHTRQKYVSSTTQADPTIDKEVILDDIKVKRKMEETININNMPIQETRNTIENKEVTKTKLHLSHICNSLFDFKILKDVRFCLFLLGGFMTIFPVVLADLFGDEMISKSFGFVTLAIGLGAFGAAPLSGFIFDSTGSYNVTFIIAGAEFFLCGIMYLVCKLLKPKVKCSSNDMSRTACENSSNRETLDPGQNTQNGK
ncbi:hypothetical protein ACF0H5_019951 [Mactra antiquata]